MMKKGQNSNHPKKGSKIKVEPLRKKSDIKLLKEFLKDKPLDFALFVVGINTNLRASDLLRLKVSQVEDLEPGDSIEIREKKTKKDRGVTFNKAAIKAIRGLLDSREYAEDDFLFIGQRGNVLKPPALNLKIKRWMKRINIKGNFGTHTFRKTWAFMQYHFNNAQLPDLMEALNHSSQKITLNYLCIEKKEVKDLFKYEV